MNRKVLLQGNEAIAEGAIRAGVRFFAGYPITPATEVAERMAVRLPEVGGVFIQMEDEIASVTTCVGAALAGKKAMTASSGPGISLKQENIGMAAMHECPMVVVDVMRVGPATGMATLPAQQDVQQARWGSHGHYEIIALAPSSPQEMFDFTIRAFHLSEEYRTPVLIMADEVVGHMNERVVIPPEEEITVVARRKPAAPPDTYLPYEAGPDGVVPMASCGEGYRIHITGLTHDERGYPVMDAETQGRMVRRIVDKIRNNRDKIMRTENVFLDDARIAVVAYGITARSAKQAVYEARARGLRAGLIKLETVWPFPEALIQDVATRLDAIIVPEINGGQMVLEVQRCAGWACQVHPLLHYGGAIIHPRDILAAVEQAVKERK